VGWTNLTLVIKINNNHPLLDSKLNLGRKRKLALPLFYKTVGVGVALCSIRRRGKDYIE
jgi:hypothetical protein